MRSGLLWLFDWSTDIIMYLKLPSWVWDNNFLWRLIYTYISIHASVTKYLQRQIFRNYHSHNIFAIYRSYCLAGSLSPSRCRNVRFIYGFVNSVMHWDLSYRVCAIQWDCGWGWLFWVHFDTCLKFILDITCFDQCLLTGHIAPSVPVVRLRVLVVHMVLLLVWQRRHALTSVQSGMRITVFNTVHIFLVFFSILNVFIFQKLLSSWFKYIFTMSRWYLR